MSEMVKALLNGEFEIILPKHRADRPEWYTEDGWEKKRLQKLHQVITSQEKPMVYYVGAEEGEMPALCQMWGAEVLLAEPNKRVLPNFKAIWEANGLTEPHIIVGFMGHKATAQPKLGEYTMDKIEGPVISDHGFSELHVETKIPVYRIDDCVRNGFPVPTVITMDVEGSEFEVLKGAEQTILKHKPVILLSLHPEFLFNYWGVYSREVRNWIIDRGYKEELLDYQHEVHLLYEPI